MLNKNNIFFIIFRNSRDKDENLIERESISSKTKSTTNHFTNIADKKEFNLKSDIRGAHPSSSFLISFRYQYVYALFIRNFVTSLGFIGDKYSLISSNMSYSSLSLSAFIMKRTSIFLFLLLLFSIFSEFAIYNIYASHYLRLHNPPEITIVIQDITITSKTPIIFINKVNDPIFVKKIKIFKK